MSEGSNQKAICFYHGSDFDGMCSGAIVQRALGDGVELVPYEYGRDLDWKTVEGRNVIMVDASLQPSKEMVKLAEKSKSLCWIDHHESVQDVVDALQDIDNVSISFDTEYAGCELTWKHFFPGKKTPRAVTLLGRYDVWDHSYSPRVLPFQYGLRLRNMDPREQQAVKMWKKFFENDDMANILITDTSQQGSIALQYQEQYDLGIMKHASFEDVVFGGLRAVIVNSASKGSTQFKSVYDEKKHDIMVAFNWSPAGHWHIGLYSTKPKIHCGEIAKTYGGGGHPGSAGFQVKELPFTLQQK